MLNQDRLADVLSEFARTLATDFPIQGILDHLVNRIVDVLPIDGAGVTLVSPGGQPRFVAASDESALRFERLQPELGEGPCLVAWATDAPISIPDLAEDDRFPLFTQRALAEGLKAVFTFPLRGGDEGLGALDLYRETPGALDTRETDAAQTLADVTSAYLLNAQARVDLEAVSATERAALEQLRVADRTKTEFLTTVIHELRTPMTSITGYTEMLQDGTLGALSDTQHRVVDAIDRNSDRLTALANDLLVLARLEEGAVRHEHTEVDLRDVVQAARVSLQEPIEASSREATFDVPDAPVVVTGHARDLERLVTNLLTNALKFTKDGGWVRCTVSAKGRSARIEVSDDGIGISQADQAHLFTRFFRSVAAQEQALSGSGLGLNIVQSIAHNHGGTVSVTSEAGHGATFVVALPLLA